MANLPCGCEVKRGEPVPLETLKAHYEHTVACLLFWEIIYRKGASQRTFTLSRAREGIIEAIQAFYPEVLKGETEQ